MVLQRGEDRSFGEFLKNFYDDSKILQTNSLMFNIMCKSDLLYLWVMVQNIRLKALFFPSWPQLDKADQSQMRRNTKLTHLWASVSYRYTNDRNAAMLLSSEMMDTWFLHMRIKALALNWASERPINLQSSIKARMVDHYSFANHDHYNLDARTGLIFDLLIMYEVTDGCLMPIGYITGKRAM